ncbi:unnamed protein product [Clonostachys byssicola]|uniref:Zn(2)-C6 fungal-type domain-containing protein n=1 Tax=Clonostachys byssicola TaxID=160290 RepID=A0A9N9UAN8_9HYPO|nr:unnamed protein product [Clonostachys byssicola]
MASSSQGRLAFKMNKTCDQCRHRKIRCIVPDTPPGTPPTCIYCTKRGQPCHFSIFRRKVRIRVPDSFSSHAQYSGELAPDELLVDRLLQYGPQNVILPDETSILTAPDEQVLSSGLAFFSEQKVASLTQKIGNTRLQDIVKKLDDYIASRLGLTDEPIWPPINFDKPEQKDRPTPTETRSYIQAYFINLHPVYPFLDQEEFESQAFSPNLDGILKQSPAFSALYHCILALGSQYLQCGTFEPGNGRSWRYFQVALGHMSDIILPRESIESVQSIFSMNLCGLQISDTLISQAARMVVTLRYHKDIVSEPKHLRVFWVIYALEKQQAIHGRTCSLIPDEDIACVVPAFPEAQVGTFNWFVAFIRIGRISSIVYNSLFSISASLRSKESYQIAMSHIRRILEDWRQSIPADYRPGDSASFPASPTTVSISLIALQVHYSYYHIIIALERLTLHLELEQGDKGQMSKQRLMNTARTIIELTKHIDVQPYVPIFILTVLPLAGVFILFDFVIHNPYHRESRTNLSLLDSAAGYFSLVSLASDRAMPSTIMSEFAEIAREYYWKSQQAKLQSSQMPMDPPSLPVTMMPESTVTQDMDQLPQQQAFVAPHGAFQMGVSESTSIPSMEYISDPQIGTPVPSEYLNYPTPMNFEAASDFQTAESGDLRSMFGWVYPEWAVGGIDLDSLNLEQPEFHGEGL